MRIKTFNKIKNEYNDKNIKITLYNNKDYIGKGNLDFNEEHIISIDNTKIKIKDIKMIELYQENIKCCPNCNNELIKIVYGMPSNEMFQKAEKGEIYLGGCIILPNNAVYYCSKCEKKYDKDLNEKNDDDELRLL